MWTSAKERFNAFFSGGTRLLLTWYRSADPARRVANAGLQPWSPLMKRRTSSRKRPFHSPHTSQLGKLPTWGRAQHAVGPSLSVLTVTGRVSKRLGMATV